MVKILREADKAPVAEVYKKHGISDQTIYSAWRRYGTLAPADVKRIRELELENTRLKRLVADLGLGKVTLQGINSSAVKLSGAPTILQHAGSQSWLRSEKS